MKRATPLLALCVACADVGADPPAIATLSPNFATNGADTPIAIGGSNFFLGGSLDLQKTSTAAVDDTFEGRLGTAALPEVRWQDTENLSAVVPAGLLPGVYELAITTPNGAEAILPDAFTVIDQTGRAPAILELRVMAPDLVGVGQTGVVVRVRVRNDGDNDALIAFDDAEIRVSSDPGNYVVTRTDSVTVVPGRTHRFLTFSVAVDPLAALGTQTVDAQVFAIDAESQNDASVLYGDPDTRTDTWDVLDTGVPADLSIGFENPPGAQVVTGQAITLTALVTNAGTCNIDNTGEVAFNLGMTGATTGGALTQSFALGVPVNLAITAPMMPTATGTVTATISTTPNDFCSSMPATVTIVSDQTSFETVQAYTAALFVTPEIAAGQRVEIILFDPDLAGVTTMPQVFTDNGGETETIVLDESPPGSGILAGDLDTSPFNHASSESGRMNAGPGDWIQATHFDPVTATGGTLSLVGQTVVGTWGAGPNLNSSSKSVIDLNGGSIQPGDTLRFEIRVRNSDEDEDADNISITDRIPSGLTYTPMTIAGGIDRDDSAAPLLTWTISQVRKDDDSETVEYYVVVDALPAGATSLSVVNVATISPENGQAEQVSATVTIVP